MSAKTEVLFPVTKEQELRAPMRPRPTNHVPPTDGLATVAFLKARFDAGKDHLDLFQPFVDEAIRHYKTDDIDLDGIRGAVRASTGLRIPAQLLKTLLQRAAKKKLLTRGGGRYLRSPHHNTDPEFAARMRDLRSVQVGLGARLRRFLASLGQKLDSDDEALAALTRFLDGNRIGVVLGQQLQTEIAAAEPRMNRAVASFVTKIIEEDGQDREVLEDIVKGLVVQNALLLRDIPTVGRHLHRLNLFVDTGVLIRALGYAGPTEQVAAVESLRLIHAAGANLRVFERTVNEIESILRVYERKLGSSEGTKSLRGTPLTYHFLRIRATPADIRQELALLKKKLQDLGFRVQEFPKHIREHTEDEQTLADSLKDPAMGPDSDTERIRHDVDVIAAILTLRAGARPTKLRDAKYVFASGSARTVSTAAHWWYRDHKRGLEPLVHFRSVANTAWLLRPANASAVPLQELVAVCAAVLRPSAQIWSGFVRGLDQLVTSGALSDDESIAVLANELTQVQLSDQEVEDDVEATTVLEIVGRVQEEQEARFRSELDTSERKQKESEQKQKESERRAAVAQAKVASIAVGAQARAERFAAWMAGGIYALFCGVLLVGALASLPTEWSARPRAGSIVNWVWWSCLGLFFGASMLGFFIRRFHVLNLYDRLKAWFTPRIRRMLLPETHEGDR